MDGQKHGQGIETLHVPQGVEEYRGEWRRDLRHGKGTLSCPDGRRAIGIWMAGLLVTGENAHSEHNALKKSFDKEPERDSLHAEKGENNEGEDEEEGEQSEGSPVDDWEGWGQLKSSS